MFHGKMKIFISWKVARELENLEVSVVALTLAD